jgi:hypothetical protein
VEENEPLRLKYIDSPYDELCHLGKKNILIETETRPVVTEIFSHACIHHYGEDPMAFKVLCCALRIF